MNIKMLAGLGRGFGPQLAVAVTVTLGLAGCGDACSGDACDTQASDESGSGSDESPDGEDSSGAGAGTFCSDADMDGYADPDNCQEVPSGEDPPPGWLPEDQASDCDDDDARSFPGAAELDDALACMQDADDDGYGNSAALGATIPGRDCDDDDPLVLDCGSWCEDLDGDGRGNAMSCVESDPSDAPPGTVANNLDCLDTVAEVYTGAAEHEAHLCTADLDDDGYGDPNAAMNYPGSEDGSDCIDSDPSVVVCVDVSAACVDILSGGMTPLMATAEGGGGGYIYAWEPPETVDDPFIDSPLANPTQTTTYTVTATDGHGNTGASEVTVHVSDADWVLEGAGSDCEAVGLIGAPAIYSSSLGGTRVCTNTNSDPTAFVCPAIHTQAQILGELQIETMNDNDFVGVVWGWQSADQFYLLTWKKVGENWGSCNAPAGVTVKRVDRQQPYLQDDFACDLDTPNATVLLTPAQTTTLGWVEARAYTVELRYDLGQTKITITDAQTLDVVTSFDVVDGSYPSGKFGSYAHSEEQACAGPWRSSCL